MSRLNHIMLLDQTLNNGFYRFKPEAEKEIFRELQSAGIDWIDNGGKVLPINAVRAADIETVAELKEQGGNVIYEPKELPFISFRDTLDLFECIGVLQPLGFTISGFNYFGHANDILRIALLADKYLPQKVALGLRPRDDLSMAMTLAYKFSELHLGKRPLYLECSLAGFGDGGMLHTDILAKLINHDLLEERYKLNKIPMVILKHISPLAKLYRGYGIGNPTQAEAIKAENEGFVIEQ